MGQNPFMTRQDWQKEKEKYGIPDKVIKSGSFGAKMEGFRKKFDTSGFSNITMPKASAALALVKEADALFDEWLKAADKLKAEAFKGAAGNKAKAIERVKWYKGLVQNLENQVKATKDPFVSARMNYDKCVSALKKAIDHPDDSAVLQTLYSQGIRNWIGAPFHAAVTTYRGDPEVVLLLKKYEQLAAQWHSTMQGNGPAAVAGDAKERKKFLSDMHDLVEMGAKILALTKPKA